MSPKEINISSPLKAIDLLKQQKLLRNVTDDVIAEVSRHIHYRRFGKRDFVVHKGDAGTSLLMLISGRLQVIALSEDGREIGLNFVETGDYFGELSIIDGGPRSASIVATTESVVGFLPKPQAEALFYRNPAVVEALLQRLCRTIRQASNYRSMLGLSRAYARVYSVLATSMRKGVGDLLTIENLPNQQAIAIMANVSRETVSRAIRSLIDSQVIERDNRRLIVRKPELLAKLARGEAGPEFRQRVMNDGAPTQVWPEQQSDEPAPGLKKQSR
ncbi:Crp/Fnr family transcriptional regulator [Burkholderia guangdongensis]|uniref:Crp/Fnr family transcriptional regulator n=1 Tax=Burkholderia guangdongensis TaxID=1792500 RepID=UPI0015C8B239|nr:Crp/Fnr family transcriptional regulator [Burkholderia guangdongensis]